MKVPASSGYHSLAVETLHVNRRELEAAEAYFLEAINRLPYLKPACLGLAQTQAQLGKVVAARARVETCAALYPGAAGVEEMRVLVKKMTRNRRGVAKDPA